MKSFPFFLPNKRDYVLNSLKHHLCLTINAYNITMDNIGNYIKTLTSVSYSSDVLLDRELKKISFPNIPEHKKIYLVVEITSFLQSHLYSFKADEDMNILIY